MRLFLPALLCLACSGSGFDTAEKQPASLGEPSPTETAGVAGAELATAWDAGPVAEPDAGPVLPEGMVLAFDSPGTSGNVIGWTACQEYDPDSLVQSCEARCAELPYDNHLDRPWKCANIGNLLSGMAFRLEGALERCEQFVDGGGAGGDPPDTTRIGACTDTWRFDGWHLTCRCAGYVDP